MQQEGLAPDLAPWRLLVWYVALGALWWSGVHWAGAQVLGSEGAALHLYPWAAGGWMVMTAAACAWQLRRMARTRALRAANDQAFAHIVRYAPVGIARVAPDTGQVLWANERLCQMLGLPADTLLGRELASFLAPVDAAHSQQCLTQLLAREIDHFQSHCHVVDAQSGRAFAVLCDVAHVGSADVPPTLVYVLKDLTEMDSARQALAQSTQQLKLALDGSSSAMWEWDAVRQGYTFSEGMAQLLHYRGTDLAADLNLPDRLHPDEVESAMTAVHHAFTTGKPLELTVRVMCFDGQYRWFYTRGMRHLNAQGQVTRFSGVCTDQTAAREEQERLRFAATVVDNTIEGIVVTDAHSRILSVNPAFTRTLGYTADELRGQTPRAFKSGRHNKAFYDAMWKSIAATGHWRGEIWNRRKNGEIFPERMSLSAVRDAEGVVSHYVCMFTDISQEKAQQQRMEFLAQKDPLTGLSNRSWMGQQLESVVQQAQDLDEIAAVLLLNLDRFKDVNGSYGHAVGDQVLKHIAHQVQEALRPGDLIGRMAGDEIIVVARNLRSAQDAQDIANRLIAAAATPWRSPDGFAVVVGVSAGICMYPEQADTAAALLQGAHAAVHGAKEGKGPSSDLCFYDEHMTRAARERIALEAKLRLAVQRQELQLYYQPQVEIATGRIVGAEALLRWLDPQEGFISPARFIPIAESSGLIGPLGEWSIAQACRDARAWQLQGLPQISVAVNVSPHQFLLSDIVACTQQALQDTGYSAAHLELEITESALATRPDEALAVLLQLRALGVRLAIDDFGTGYSSLAHLKRFPIDVLKIDQGFIRDIPHSKDDMAISRTIIAMGHSLDMKVLAEGVETAEHLAFLRQNGCDYFQGYFCSKPVPAAQFAQLLMDHNPRELAAPAMFCAAKSGVSTVVH